MFTKIQNAVAGILQAHPGFPPGLKIIARREKELANDIDGALAKLGICIYVIAPVPMRATPTQCEIAFFESCELRVRIIEQPNMNTTGFDVWNACTEITRALQGTNPDNLFAAPIGLAEHPVETLDGQTKEGKSTRVWDVIFDGAFQLN